MKEYDVTLEILVRVLADNPQLAATTAINKVKKEMDNDTVDAVDVEEVKISEYKVEVGGNIVVNAKSCEEAKVIVREMIEKTEYGDFVKPTGNVDEI